MKLSLIRMQATAAIAAGFLGTASLAYAQSVPAMDPGDSSSSVSALQTFLAADSSIYPEGLITGYYGSLTIAAVQRYQCKYGIVCQGTPSTTGYGRVGPVTAAKIEAQGGFMGGSAPSTSSDVSAPIISAPVVTTTSNGATITWSTNEPATDAVLYSTFMPSLNAESFASMSVISDPSRDANGTVALSGLSLNTRYYYVLRSVDTAGNLQYSIYGLDHPFVTNP